MKLLNCDFCGSADSTPMHVLADIRLGLPGKYTLVRCEQCGLLYLDPQPSWEQLESHYPRDYHCYENALEEEPSAFVRWAKRFGLQRRCQAVIQRKSGGRLLDIGCSTGIFLDEMRRHGDWEVVGVEPIPDAAEYARQHFGLDVYAGELLEAAFSPTSFDIVTLWDVLEHTPNPRAILQEIYQILKPGGWIVMKVPDPDSWEAHLFGSCWVGFEAPQHLFGFPSEVLKNKLTEIGFKNFELAIIGSDYATFMTSLKVWLEKKDNQQLGSVAGMLARSTLARVLSMPVLAAMRSLGLNSSGVYFAQKSR
jgi:SAM-dependent methyltransferase